MLNAPDPTNLGTKHRRDPHDGGPKTKPLALPGRQNESKADSGPVAGSTVPGQRAQRHPYPSVRTAKALISIRNLRLRTYIGFNVEEMAKRQDVIINIEIGYRMSPGVFNDCVSDALNYKTITKAVIAHVESGRFLLLEKLVADVLAICRDHDAVYFASVRIDKPHALRFADSVSLTLEYGHDEFHEAVGKLQ